MDLKDYFENAHGFGVLATADKNGTVNAAVYARPHMTDDGEAAFIMANRRSHRNISENPSASYLFHAHGEDTEGPYDGVRISLTYLREDDDQELIDTIRRRLRMETGGKRHLVYFRVDEVRPLIGDKPL